MIQDRNPKKMNISLTGIMILCFLLSSCSTMTTSHLKASQCAESWLLRSCNLEEEGVAERDLVQCSPKAELVLLTTLLNGPNRQQSARLENSLSTQWEFRTQTLNSSEGSALGPENLEIARQVTREEFFTRGGNSFELGLKDKAIGGLGIIGTEISLIPLTKIASDQNSPLNNAARRAIKNITERDSINSISVQPDRLE